VFLVGHVVMNAMALWGDRAFVEGVRRVERVPALGWFESVFIFIPLLVHGGIGLWFVVTRKPLRERSAYPRSVAMAVRVTGVVSLAFLAMHLPEFRFRIGAGMRPDGNEIVTFLAMDLSSTWKGLPLRGVAYLAGAGCAVFHFATGLWGAFARTGRGMQHSKERRWAAWAMGGLGAALWITLADLVVLHATGGPLLEPTIKSNPPVGGMCPAPGSGAQ
jgi:succinate dehydrogenase / fumarate reductase cytochrome b subunit